MFTQHAALSALNKLVANFWNGEKKINKDNLVVFEELKDPLPWIVITLSSLIGLFASYDHLLTGLFLLTLLIYTAVERSKKEFNNEIENYLNELTTDPEGLKNFLKQINCPQDVKKCLDNSETVDWANDIIAQLWPFINLNIQKAIDRKNFSKSGFELTSGERIFFQRITLGDQPPILAGIEVKSGSNRADEIVLDLKTIYCGNACLSFSKTSVKLLKLKAGIKEIYFRANGRLILRPLLDFPPYIGGVSFCLLDKPLIDYDIFNLTNVVDRRLFKKFLINLISNCIVSPNEVYFNFTQKLDVIKGLKFRIPIGLCYFQIIEAENLPRERINRIIVLQNASDSYCKVTVGNFKFRTSVVFNNCNPFWGDTHAVPIQDLYETFKVEIYDKDAVKVDSKIGTIEFKVNDIAVDHTLNGAERWLPICKAESGELHFRAAYFKLTDDLNQLHENVEKLGQVFSKFPIAIISIYIYRVSFKKGCIKTRLNPLIHLKCSGKYDQFTPLNQTGKRDFQVEKSCHFTTNDPNIEVINIAIINLRRPYVIKETSVNLSKQRVIGTCAISIKALIENCQSSKLNIDREFKFSNRSKLGVIQGSIRVCICLNLCKIEEHIFDNIKRPIVVKSSMEPTTLETSLLRRIVRQPKMVIKKPIQTIKLLPSIFSNKHFSNQIDLFPVPLTMTESCNVKLRFKWPERKFIRVDIIRLVNLPDIFLSENYKYSIMIKMELNPRLNLDENQIKHCLTHPLSLFQKTRKFVLPKGQKSIEINQRIFFKICPNHFIDDYVLSLGVKLHITKGQLMLDFFCNLDD